jgi:hypothetical protein
MEGRATRKAWGLLLLLAMLISIVIIIIFAPNFFALVVSRISLPPLAASSLPASLIPDPSLRPRRGRLQAAESLYSRMHTVHSCILGQTATTTCDLRAIDLLHIAS